MEQVRESRSCHGFYMILRRQDLDGENDIRIEVATTLERERGVNKGKQAPIGIYSTVKIYQI